MNTPSRTAAASVDSGARGDRDAGAGRRRDHPRLARATGFAAAGVLFQQLRRPWSSSALAIPKPMPLEAPVTTLPPAQAYGTKR